MMILAASAEPAPGDKLSVRRLILELLSAAPESMSASAQLVRAGEVFDFSANQVRVALSRLVADGLLASPQRGRYQLAGDAQALRAETGRWRHLQEEQVSWQGQWCGLLVETQATEGSTAFRRQSRALELRGLRRWKPGLWVRPDNLTGGLAQLADDVAALGASITGTVQLQPQDDDARQQLQALWDTAQLDRQYRQALKTLRAAHKRLSAGATRKNLRDTIEIGGAMIRQLLFDPLLPDAMLSGTHRQALISALEDYDLAGQRVWQDFIERINDMNNDSGEPS